MRRWTRLFIVLALVGGIAAVGPATADDLLPYPFTAEQIRDAMPVGLVVMVENITSQGSARQQWTVLAAGAEGLTIEYVDLSADGEVSGEPVSQPATWIALRDHASFPSSLAHREEASRETALGKLDGWLYTVTDSKAGTVTELFFAKDYPGAPVHLTVTKGKEQLLLMQQLERHLP